MSIQHKFVFVSSGVVGEDLPCELTPISNIESIKKVKKYCQEDQRLHGHETDHLDHITSRSSSIFACDAEDDYKANKTSGEKLQRQINPSLLARLHFAFHIRFVVADNAGKNNEDLNDGLEHVCVEIGLLINLHPSKLAVVALNNGVNDA